MKTNPGSSTSSGSCASGSSASGSTSEEEEESDVEDDDDSEGDIASRLKHLVANFCCCICTGVTSCCRCCKRTKAGSDTSPEALERTKGVIDVISLHEEQRRCCKCPSSVKCYSFSEAVDKFISVRKYVRDSLEFAEYGKLCFFITEQILYKLFHSVIDQNISR